jgi:hypothetical protein
MPVARQPRRRRTMSESQLVAAVEESARSGSWNAAAWLLERRWPQRWLKPTDRRSKPPSPEDNHDPFAEIIELAQRRTL